LGALVTPVTAELSLLLLFSSLLLLFATAIPSSKKKRRGRYEKSRSTKAC
jgi:Sec-independent protein secretion pathway component TatC